MTRNLVGYSGGQYNNAGVEPLSTLGGIAEIINNRSVMGNLGNKQSLYSPTPTSETSLPAARSVGNKQSLYPATANSPSTPTPTSETSLPAAPTQPNLTDISYNPKNPKQTLADITKQNNEIYEGVYVPVEDEVISTLGDSNIATGARDRAERGFDSLAGRQKRGLSRYGVSLTPAQQREMDRTGALARSLTVNSTVNSAELAQRERDENLRNELINIGRGVAQEAQSTFSDASALQTQRDVNNAQAKASEKATGAQAVGTIASAAILIWAGI